MATKTDYYNRIISSLQSEITDWKTIVSELQKEMAEMRTELKDASERNETVEQIPVESNPTPLSLRTLPRKEVEILLSKMKAVCDQAIRANHENYVEMFATRSELDSLRESLVSTTIPEEAFDDFKESQEKRLNVIEEKVGKRFSFITIKTIKRNLPAATPQKKLTFNLRRFLQALEFNDLQWIISLIVSLFIGMLSLYLFHSIDT